MKKKVIIYDFDGTLADTLGRGVEIYNTLAKEKGYREITKENIPLLREQSIPEIAESLGFSLVQIPFLLAHIRGELKNDMARLKPFPGMRETLLALREKGFVQKIMSSNSLPNIQAFLTANHINIFDSLHSVNNLFGKAASLKRVMVKEDLSPSEITYVGDEIRDIEGARGAGVTAVSVTWGVNSKTALAQKHPDFLADTPEELLAFFLKP